MKEFTTNEIAARYKVTNRVARRWCEEGKFPNARQLPVTVGRGQPWLVPESDLENFEHPKMGRPRSENPSPAALAKREQRKAQKKVKSEE